MSDPYLDQNETQAYGPFAIAQIDALVLGIDPVFKKALSHTTALLQEKTTAVAAAVHKAGALDVTTYKSVVSEADPVATGRDLMRRVVKYAESRPGGDAIAARLLNAETLTTVLRRRPAKLIASMTHAVGVLERHKDALPEHKQWSADLTAARDALDELDKNVRKSRIERRGMTPEVQAARADWLKVYGTAKLLVEAVLRLHDKTALLPEIFDDLAEVHRVSGVSDETPAETPVVAALPA